MNVRNRQKIKAIKQRKVTPIMGIIRDKDLPVSQIVFIDPRHWDEEKAKYGDRLQKIF